MIYWCLPMLREGNVRCPPARCAWYFMLGKMCLGTLCICAPKIMDPLGGWVWQKPVCQHKILLVPKVGVPITSWSPYNSKSSSLVECSMFYLCQVTKEKGLSKMFFSYKSLIVFDWVNQRVLALTTWDLNQIMFKDCTFNFKPVVRLQNSILFLYAKIFSSGP